jgi:hypothetical protein
MTSNSPFLRGGGGRLRRADEQTSDIVVGEEHQDEHEEYMYESEAEPQSVGIVPNQESTHDDTHLNDEEVDHLHEEVADHTDDHHFEGDGHDHAALLTRTQASKKGYDVDAGKDPICWLTPGTTSPALGVSDISTYPNVWHTSFADDFYAAETAMMQKCFHGFELVIQAPPLEEREEFGRLYTNTEYTYRVRGRLDVSELQRMLVDDDIDIYGEGRDYTTGELVLQPRVSVELIFCRLRTVGGGLCSPFVYQHDIHGDSHVEENDGSFHEHRVEVHGDEDENQHHDEEEDVDHHNEANREANSDEALYHDEEGHAEVHHFSEDSDDGNHNHKDEEVAHSEDDHAFLQSEVIMFDVLPNEKTIDLNANISFSMVEEETVFAIAAVRTLLSPGGSSMVVYKFDASNIVVERALQYESPPQINTISQGTLGFSYALIGLVGIGISALLFLVVKHRKHKVFMLSQGSFLVVFLGSGLVSGTSSFLLNPKTDVHCQLYSPLIMIPLQLMVAVVICRLWRIYTLMRPLMQWADSHQKILSTRDARRAARRWLPKFHSTSTFSQDGNSSETKSTVSKRSKGGGGATSLRRKVTAKHLSVYTFLITLPQIVVQCVIGAVSPMTLEIYWNDEMSIGRPRCRSSVGAFNWLPYLVFFLSVLVLLAVAFRTRNLPSLFNEAGSMFSSVAVTVCVAAIGIALILSTHTPTSSPDVGYLVSVVIVLVFTGQLSWRCVYPKLQLVWSGEAIVVSKLFQSKKNLGPNGSVSVNNNRSNATVPSKVGVEPSSRAGIQPQASDTRLPNTSTITLNEAAHLCEVTDEHERGHERERHGHVAFSSTATDITHESIHISEEGLPPKELTMMMLQLSQQISKNNSRTLSGMRVSRGEWQEMKDAVVRMGNIFEQDVKFDWDTSAEQAPNEKFA